MSSFNRLVEIFSDFPGIGPRQAKRFVYFLLTKSPAYTKDFVRAMEDLRANTLTCTSCFRIFSKNGGPATLCNICSNQNRDLSTLAIVSRDSDLESLEKSGSFTGLYFVLGGIIPILEADPESKIRARELVTAVEKKVQNGLKEIILAMSANADSENTSEYVERLLAPYKEKGVKISHLGRGLSTGTELEYSDAETLKNALSNRK
jgi:recombination protein RecR